MRIIILIFLFIIFSIPSHSQTKLINENYYLNKSKNQKSTGFVLLGTGAILIVTGAIVQHNSIATKGAFLNFDGLGYQFAGLTAMLSSIPFFIWAAKNKRKTIAITINNQNYFIGNSKNIALKPMQTLGLRLKF